MGSQSLCILHLDPFILRHIQKIESKVPQFHVRTPKL